MGPLELIILVVISFLVVRAIARGQCGAGLAGIGLFLVIGMIALWAYARANQARHAEFEAHEQQTAFRIATSTGRHGEWNSHVELVPDSHMMIHRVDGKLSFAGLAVMILIGIGVLTALRRHRGAGAGFALAIAGIVGGVILLQFLRFGRNVGFPAPPVAVSSTPMPPNVVIVEEPAGEMPIDELWNRLNESRIHLSAPVEPASPNAQIEESDEADGDAAARGESAAWSDEEDHGEAQDAQPENLAEADHNDESGATAASSTIAETDAAEHGVDDHGSREQDSEENARDDHESHEPDSGDDWVDDAPAEPAAPAPSPVPSNDAANPAAEPAEVAAEAKPDWIAIPPKLVGNVRRQVIQAGPYSTLEECHNRLRVELSEAARRRIEELARQETGRPAYAPELWSMGLSEDYLVGELLFDQYLESGMASFGPTLTAWGLLEFTPEDDRQLLSAWKSYRRQDGFKHTLLLSATVLAALGFVFGLLKLDTWTRGYYTKRLFIGVPAAIIVFVFLVAVIMG